MLASLVLAQSSTSALYAGHCSSARRVVRSHRFGSTRAQAPPDEGPVYSLATRVGRDTFQPEFDEEEVYTPQWEMVLQPIGGPEADPFQVARRVLPVLLAHALWATGITALSFRYQLWAPPMLHSLLGGVLGLLLAFRTNQAYLRYQQLCASWVDLSRATLNMARTAAQLDFKTYSAVLRHIIAFPIAVKQSLRRTRNEKEFYTSLWVTELEQLDARLPTLSILGSLSMLLRPLKANDDGSGRDIALWNHMERGVEEMQGVASRFDSLAQLPPPPSYSLLVSRFLLLWSATLPFTMLSVLPRWCVPPCMFLVAWALYSTEELAQLMEEPCGNPLKAETLPLEQVRAPGPWGPTQGGWGRAETGRPFRGRSASRW